MSHGEIRRLQRPKIFDPFALASIKQVRELVSWLNATDRARSEAVPSPDVALSEALEKMLKQDMRLWTGDARRLRLFAHVPMGIHLEPYIGWPRGAKTVEYGLRGSNDAAKAYLVVLKLQKARLLHRLRRCNQCREWCLAYHPSRDRFCSDSCRERAHRESRKTPEGRTKRAAYMRAYRETLRRMSGVRVRRGQKHGLPVSKKGMKN